MSRFEQYRTESDLAPLRKLEVGESFTATLVGVHDYRTTQPDEHGMDTEVVHPVLTFREKNGRQFAWMASTWHAKDELDVADPSDGDVVSVRRLPNRGRSHQFEVDVVESATEPQSIEPEPEFGRSIAERVEEMYGDEPPY